MSNSPNQPRPNDAVLGSQSSPSTGAVLGGLEGVKRRLASESEELRIAALKDACKYGQEGLDQVIRIAKTETGAVHRIADDLLWESVDEKEKSEVGENYNRLRDLLVAGKWKLADQDTGDKMQKIVGVRIKEVLELPIYAYSRNRRKQVQTSLRARVQTYLEPEDIKKFPCKDLRTINQLWVRYSNGRFGFSVQKQIWIEEGGKPGIDHEESYLKFCQRVGWRGNLGMTFTANAPIGHLPVGGVRYDAERIEDLGRSLISSPEQVFALVSRLRECNI
ncbi:GUN4 domain-containing protein [Microcoleus sp. FACHB-53]|nr:GUN4 domain-containing protein [Microcoleus sp. FACHB-53]